MEKDRSLFGPLLLIAAGLMWLLIKSGSVPTANLWALTHIWPYLLIVAGLGLILRAYWKYSSLVVDVLIVGGVVLAIFYAPQLGWDNPIYRGFQLGDEFWRGPTVPGSGNIITQEREVGGFEAVAVDFPGQVFISQGEAESVKVKGDDNLLPALKSEIKNGTLRIYYASDDGKHVNPSKPVVITIVAKELKDVNFETAGDLHVDGIQNTDLNVNVSGAGNLEMTDISVDRLTVNLSGAGNMTASGTTGNLVVTISGFGNFNGADMHSKSAEIDLSGAGNATVWADESLKAAISGAGSVNYYGAATVKKQVSGLGNVKHLGNK